MGLNEILGELVGIDPAELARRKEARQKQPGGTTEALRDTVDRKRTFIDRVMANDESHQNRIDQEAHARAAGRQRERVKTETSNLEPDVPTQRGAPSVREELARRAGGAPVDGSDNQQAGPDR